MHAARVAIAGLIVACGCWPAAAQLDKKPPVLKRGDNSGKSSRKKTEADETKSGFGLVTATGIIRRIDEKVIQIAAEDTRLITCNLNGGTVLSGPSGKIALSSFAPGMRVKVHAKSTEDGEELVATSLELDAAAVQPKDLKTAAVEPAQPDEEGRPILRRGIPPKRKADESADAEIDNTGATASPPANTERPASAAPPRSNETPAALAGHTGQENLIEKARSATAEFSVHLPNFFCQQFTTRYKRETRESGWQAEDVVSATVVYVDGKEDYQNIKVGNRPSPKGMMDLKGQRSVGEFGMVLESIMNPAAQAEFTFVKNFDLRRQKTKVYDFAVKRENSDWGVKIGGQSILPAYSGRMWIEPESGRVLRIERQADRIPESFPNDVVEQTIDYEFVTIGSRKSLLPTHSENLSCERGSALCGKNVIEFRNYKEFRGESTVDFDTPPK